MNDDGEQGRGRGLPNLSSEIEKVDHPQHYGGKDNPHETIKCIEAWGLGYALGNATKYISRAGKKDPLTEVEDLRKAMWYLEHHLSGKEVELQDTVERFISQDQDLFQLLHDWFVERNLHKKTNDYKEHENWSDDEYSHIDSERREGKVTHGIMWMMSHALRIWVRDAAYERKLEIQANSNEPAKIIGGSIFGEDARKT